MPDHSDVVATVKHDLEARGFDLGGPCGAFAITQRVAWALRGSGFGLLDKPGGNNCGGYATDIVLYPDGHLVDILGDGGGANTPTWNETGEVRPLAQFRPPVDPGDVVAPPKPPDPPPPDAILEAIAGLRGQVAAIDLEVDALARQSDFNTEKIQRQINEVVKNGEKSLTDALAVLKLGRAGFPGRLFGG